MFHAVDLSELQRMTDVRRSMFTHRAAQFVSRHKWPLAVQTNGFEVDEFDDGRSTYCVVEERGSHQASLRLRPAAAGSMVERRFAPMWRPELRGGVEVTRFCASPALSPDDRLAAVSDLLLGLCRHCQRTGIESFFGVVFPSVARVIRQSGWATTLVDRMEDEGGALLLCEWRASEMVAWSIQESREFRERIWSDRRAAMPIGERLVA